MKLIESNRAALDEATIQERLEHADELRRRGSIQSDSVAAFLAGLVMAGIILALAF